MDSATRTTVHSTITGTQGDLGVQRFLGLRFATAARFGRPVSEPMIGAVDATSFGPACPQIAVHSPLVPGGSLGAAESEDCLHLNVWVPDGTPECGLPAFWRTQLPLIFNLVDH